MVIGVGVAFKIISNNAGMPQNVGDRGLLILLLMLVSLYSG